MTRHALRILCMSLPLSLLPGCLSFVNPVPAPTPEQKELCQQLPLPACHNVYVVLVNGVDLLQCGNLEGVRSYLAGLGFVKSYYAQIYHEPCLIKDLREMHQMHPDARLVIVAFEYGAGPACKLARECHEQGLRIDRVIYMQPKWLGAPSDVSLGSVRSITIRAGSHKRQGEAGADAAELTVPSWTRYGVPTHPETLALLANELSQLASGIPQTDPLSDPFPPILDEPPPTPRPLPARDVSDRDQWDFLKPTRAQTPEPVPAKDAARTPQATKTIEVIEVE